MRSILSRRSLLKLSAGGLLLPRPLFAAAAPPERRFLFVFNQGGWDTSRVFASTGHVPDAEVEAGATEATAGGIRFVDHADRPSVRAFLETWGDRTCVINGVEIQSIAHERCRQLVLTGSAGTGADDWPSILAAHASTPLALPYVVLDGIAFTSRYSDVVVRVGDRGQLPELLDGSALSRSDVPVPPPTDAARAAADAFVEARLSEHIAAADPGGRALLEGYLDKLSARHTLDDLAGELDISVQQGSCERDIVADAATAFSLFTQGVSRCAMIRYNGWCGEGWDTHSQLYRQSWNYEDLFSYLDAILGDLDGRVGASGAPLAEEVTVVVFSEMGRSPYANSWGGKDHWTFTSAVLLGAGVRGGQVIGGIDEGAQGAAIDLATGGVDAAGTRLVSGHLGATLLAMGGLDPAELLPGLEPIAAAMD